MGLLTHLRISPLRAKLSTKVPSLRDQGGGEEGKELLQSLGGGHNRLAFWEEDVKVKGGEKIFRGLIVFVMFSGLANFSFSDSLNVRWVGSWSYGGAYPIAVGEVKGIPYAFLGSGGGIIIFDVSNPSSPVKVGEAGTPWSVNSLFFLNNRLYVANDDGGLRIYDASDPSSPLFLGNCPIFPTDPLNDRAIDVWVKGDYAYIAANTYGLQIVDVSNHSSPKEIGHYDTPGQAFDVSVQGNYAYVADRHGGLRIIDVSDPSHPEEVGVWIPWWDTFIFSVFVSGDYAYLVWDVSGLIIIDISDPLNPECVGRYFADMEWYWKVGIWVSGNLAYFTSQSVGLLIIDVSNPEEPKKLGEYPMSHWYSDIWVYRHHAYVTTSGEGIPSSFLYIINVSNPSNPERASIYVPPQKGFGAKLEVSGNYAYIIKGDSLLIIDIADQMKSKKIATFPAEGYRDMELYDSYLYLSTTKKEPKQTIIHIVDISIPTELKEVISHPLPFHYFKEMEVSGNYLYGIGIDSLDSGATHPILSILNISDPLYPKEVGRFKGWWEHGWIIEFSVSGNYICAAGGGAQLWIIDISNPKEPKEVGTYHPSEGILLVCVDAVGDYMYAFGDKIEENIFIMEVVDVSNPANPRKVGFVEIPEKRSFMTGFKMGSVPGWVLRVVDSYAYVGSVWKLWIIDVSDPTNPEIVGFHDTYYISDIKVMREYIYAADQFFGLQIFEFYGDEGVKEKSFNFLISQSCNLSISPNPIKGIADIRYEIPDKGPVSFQIYDAAGRLVRTLLRAKGLEHRAKSITWDGRDDEGELLPSGIYFCELKAGDYKVTKKIILVR